MTESENETVVEKIFEANNRRDSEAFISHLSDDMTAILPSGRTLDKKGLRREFPISSPAFPDGISRIDRMVSQGNTVWVEYTFTGTHKGDSIIDKSIKIPATNKKVKYPAISIYDFEAGKVKLWKLYFDRLRFINQIHEHAVAELWDKITK